MWYAIVSIFDALAGRMIAGVLNLSSSHPVAVALMLSVLMILVCGLWLEMMGVRFGGTPDRHDRPVRLRRP